MLQFRHNTGDRISIRMANVKTLHSKLKRNQKMKNLGGMGVCMVGRGRGVETKEHENKNNSAGGNQACQIPPRHCPKRGVH